jgi:hypothetical protein
MNQKRKRYDFELSDSDGEQPNKKRLRIAQSEFAPSLESVAPLQKLCTQQPKIELDEDEATDIAQRQEEQKLTEMQRTILKHGGEFKVLKKFGGQRNTQKEEEALLKEMEAGAKPAVQPRVNALINKKQKTEPVVALSMNKLVGKQDPIVMKTAARIRSLFPKKVTTAK